MKAENSSDLYEIIFILTEQGRCHIKENKKIYQINYDGAPEEYLVSKYNYIVCCYSVLTVLE